jgi:thiamine pyrophosphokinase
VDAWIFANGIITERDLLKDRIATSSLIIAADGGLHYIREMGLIPQVLIGDLDSVSEEDHRWAESREVQILRYPADKNETDLELALEYALKSKPEFVRIAGATGGRIDQALGNIFLLMRSDLTDINIRLEDGLEEIFLIRKDSEIQGTAGDIVSLLPLGAPVCGIYTSGLEYSLSGETLYPEKIRGVSNVMINNQATVRVNDGVLLCIHTRNGNTRRKYEV